MEITDFINNSGLEFKDITSEETRTYHFANGTILHIRKPLLLNVSNSGGHRLVDESGVCYYIHPSEGWWLQWMPKPGKPHFVK